MQIEHVVGLNLWCKGSSELNTGSIHELGQTTGVSSSILSPMIGCATPEYLGMFLSAPSAQYF